MSAAAAIVGMPCFCGAAGVLACRRGCNSSTFWPTEIDAGPQTLEALEISADRAEKVGTAGAETKPKGGSHFFPGSWR